MTDQDALERCYWQFVSYMDVQLAKLPADEPDLAGRGENLLELADKFNTDTEKIKTWITRARWAGLPIFWERLSHKENGKEIQAEYLRFATFDQQRALTYYEHGRKVIEGIAWRFNRTANGALDNLKAKLPDVENTDYYKKRVAFYEEIVQESNQIIDIVGDKAKGRQTDFAELDSQTADSPAKTDTNTDRITTRA